MFVFLFIATLDIIPVSFFWVSGLAVIPACNRESAVSFTCNIKNYKTKTNEKTKSEQKPN